MDIDKVLEKEGIRDFKKDIRRMTPRELHRYFSFRSSGKLNVTNLIKNIIWQSYNWISQGKMDPVEGNIRSFWYLSVKSVLSRLGLNVAGRRYLMKVYDAFGEMITVYHLFRYADFGFIDERLYVRRIGQANGNLILFIEKDGLFGLPKQVAQDYDATAIALGGFPSQLTTEFLVRNMARVGLLRQPVRLFSVVDYDPGGYWIEREFIRQLQDFGVEIAATHSLVNPDILPRDLLEIAKYRLKKGTKARNWLRETGGIGGSLYGLEADALGGKRMRELYKKAIEPYISKDKAIAVGFNVDKESYWKWLAKEPVIGNSLL